MSMKSTLTFGAAAIALALALPSMALADPTNPNENSAPYKYNLFSTDAPGVDVCGSSAVRGMIAAKKGVASDDSSLPPGLFPENRAGTADPQGQGVPFWAAPGTGSPGGNGDGCH